MMNNINIASYLLAVLLLMGLTACSDSSTGPDNNKGNPPSVPQLKDKVLTVDFSYFKQGAQQMVQGAKEKSNYQKAQRVALNSSNFFKTAQIYVPFLSLAKNKNAEFKNGHWIWNYSYDYGKNSYTIKLTSSKNKGDGSSSWALYFSADSPNQQIDNYKFMEGTVAADGLSGQWQINGMEPDSKFRILFEWKITGENEKELIYTIYDDSGDKKISVNYTQTGAKYLLEYAVEYSGITEIGWNTDTRKGHYKDPQQVIYCWNKNRENVQCSAN